MSSADRCPARSVSHRHHCIPGGACGDQSPVDPDRTSGDIRTARVGKALAAERGLTFSPSKVGHYVSGTLVGSTQLASGRFAMIDDGIGFQLVPWQPLLEQRIGRHITGIVRDAGGIEWSFGRNRGLEL